MSETVDQLLRLEAALPLLKGAVEQQHLGKALSAAVIACEDVPRKLERLRSLASTIARLTEYLPQRADEILDSVDMILDLGKAMENASEIQHLESIVREVRSLDTALSSLHRSVLALTQFYAREHVAPLSALERLLRRLGREEVANAIEQLRVMESGLPSAGLLLPEKVAALQRERDALSSDLTRLASDPEVDAFLTGFATNGSVTLSLVTGKVLEWLGNQSALDQFTVQPIA